jgi:hypothetical protein
MAHVFVSYVRENTQDVDRLCRDLAANNVEVWLDRTHIKPGVRWGEAIRSAIQQGTYFVACFSKEYEARTRSFMNEELTLAIDEMRRQPPERTWFIPVLLSPCNIPDIHIGAGQTLRDVQYVALYEDWDKGVRQITAALKRGLPEPHEIDPRNIPHFEDQFETFEKHFVGLSQKIDRLLSYHEDSQSGSLRSRGGQVNPPWRSRDFGEDPDLCFLLMPFSEVWSDDVWRLIRQVVGKCGLKCQRADEKGGRLVMDDVWEGICNARIIIAELTGGNPNVTYEVGLADSLGKKIVLLSQTTDVPFDFAGQRLILYENSIAGVRMLSEQLETRLNALLEK